jgi:hypothetical protein
MYRIDTRLAPLLTIFLGLVFTYFFTQIISNTFFVIDGLAAGIATGNPMMFIGFVLYGALSVLILFIFIRFLSSWFVFRSNTFLGFVTRVTDPILLPVQRLIPPDRVKAYLEDLERQLATIADCQEDDPSLEGRAHMIVSQAGMLGLTRLSECARAVEDACRSGASLQRALAQLNAVAGDVRRYAMPAAGVAAS